MGEDNEDTNVRVAVRCRPMNSRETAMGTANCVQISATDLTITGPGGDDHSFRFDIILGEDSLQTQLWDHIGTPILEKAFSGYNGTIFAYGQTGSGKTWSMQGGKDDMEGVIPRMNNAIFDRIACQKAQTPTLHFLVTVSYFELHNEVIFDLLDVNDRKTKRAGLEIKEHPVLGVYVKGLKEIVVDCPMKIQGIVDQGMKARTVASTQMNADSSRSHSVFTLKIHQKDSEDESRNLFAKVNLVDLAGSERVKSTGASGATLKEGANINKSLSALGNVINALVEQSKNPKKGAFIPYRNSKLTRVLQESLGGNSITVMIAALSPALCNFEETLSTLKYANRAKAIKVRAVKNDESSQVGRLNEEIKALKDKLQAQASNVDTSLLEEKHQQQLRDLEEAMKSTWEEKARISQAHENDRKRLLEEQAEAEKKLSLHQEKSWNLLEEKGDLGLSIGRVIELFEAVDQTVFDHGMLSGWPMDFRDILKLEENLSEQDTVVEVYNVALHRDACRFVVGVDGVSSETVCAPNGQPSLSTGGRGDSMKFLDNGGKLVTVGTWKQMREKFHSLQIELSKWLEIRDHLGSLIDNLLISINGVYQLWFEDCQHTEQKNDFPEVSRGLNLVKTQAYVKKQAFDAYADRPDSIANSYHALAVAMHETMCVHEKLLLQSNTVNDTEGSSDSTKRAGIVDEIRNNILAVKSIFSSFESSAMPSLKARSCQQNTVELRNFEVKSGGMLLTNMMPSINSEHPWIITKNETNNEDYSTFVEVTFPQSESLARLIVQGGNLPKKLPKNIDSIFTALPCGLRVEDCDGAIDKTVLALADIFSWENITKNNSPETFLKRPPVRFLFDVINAVDAVTNNHLMGGRGLAPKDWTIVGTSKETKLAFMDEILQRVSDKILLPPPTTANSIVTGANADLTNIFLQHLSIVAFTMSKGLEIVNVPLLPSPSPNAMSREDADQSDHISRSQHTWVDEIKLSWSDDGQSFSTVSQAVSTNLKDSTSIESINIENLNAGKRIKSIRIYPCKWETDNSCLRLAFHAYASVSISDCSSEGEYASSLTCVEILQLLRNATDILGVSADYIVKIEDMATVRKQEEAMKKMESIVGEKIAKEQALLDEKLALSSEKCSLEEQLKAAMSKLHEMEKTVVQEKSHRMQLEELRTSLDEDKKSLQVALQEQVEALSDAQTQLLKFHASAERDSKLVKSLQKRSENDHVTLSNLNAELSRVKDENNSLKKDCEDLLNQVEVLTDERDDARRNEEELFIALGERTYESEILQESYVTMSDRCNGYMDDIFDLEANIASLKNLVDQGLSSKTKDAPFNGQLTGSQSTPKLLNVTDKSMQNDVVSKITSHPEAASTAEGILEDDNDNYDEEFEDDGE